MHSIQNIIGRISNRSKNPPGIRISCIILMTGHSDWLVRAGQVFARKGNKIKHYRELHLRRLLLCPVLLYHLYLLYYFCPLLFYFLFRFLFLRQQTSKTREILLDCCTVTSNIRFPCFGKYYLKEFLPEFSCIPYLHCFFNSDK